MYCTRKINDDYTWVGADCRRLAMFEGVYDVPQGISFNSYLLTDEKTVLFDTVDSAVRHTFRENLTHALAGRELDYVVVHHMEPDHAAELADLLRDYPRTQVLCSAMAKTMIGQFFGPELAGRITVIKEGETLSTGRHTLHFVAAPMVHWPEVMLTYDATDKLLLSADAFGCFGALNGALFADEVNFDRDYLDEARRYYTNIVGKYGPQVQAVLKKAETLDIQMLLPLHGFVWREELGYLLGKYDLWSRYEPEVRGVMIAYASVYGGTENAANVLACRLAEQGVQVKMFDVSVTPAPYVVSDAFKYSHLVFASATYNMGIFVTMENLLHDIAAHALAATAVRPDRERHLVAGQRQEDGCAAVPAEGLVRGGTGADGEVGAAAGSGGPDAASGRCHCRRREGGADGGGRLRRGKAPLRVQGVRLRLRGRRAAGRLQMPAVRRRSGVFPAGGLICGEKSGKIPVKNRNFSLQNGKSRAIIFW